MRRLFFVPLFALACATAETAGSAAAPPPPAHAWKLPPFNAKAFADRQVSPTECETTARSLRDHSSDEAWAALNACADRRRWPRGQFTLLESLTNGNWDDELQNRPDASRLIARVVANRGGDVEGDVPLIQGTRMPLFTMSSAVKQPQTYKGRWVLMRGMLSLSKDSGGSTAIVIKETVQRAGVTHDVRDGDRVSGFSPRWGAYTTETMHAKTNNDRVETGLVVVGKVPEADPFLEPGKDFIFFGRFDGIRPGSDSEPVGMLTVAGYYKPSDLVLQ